jgi:alpha/beta hydrolase family protein
MKRLVYRLFFQILVFAGSFSAIILCSESVNGEVIRLEIKDRTPFADGYQFGRSGSYEKITGRVYFTVDPDHPDNRSIVDLTRAPRDATGKVAFWSDFCLLSPVDPTRGNRRLIYAVNNRGNKLMLQYLNDADSGNNLTSLADAGNGFLMRRGYSILWSGWNGDVLPGNGRLTADFPIAREGDKPIEGKVYIQLFTDHPVSTLPLVWGNTDPYPTTNLDHSSLRLTMRLAPDKEPIEIAPDSWAFARWDEKQKKPIPDPKHIYIKAGFKPGWLYELVYTARDPRVTGLGFVSVRDIVSFFRYQKADPKGVENPLSGTVDYAYAFGISQSGRFLNHFIYDGFNTDRSDRTIFDGVMPIVAGAGRGFFNHRFAQTTRYSTTHEETLFPCDRFPFSTTPQKDPATGKTTDILAKARQSGALPKIFYVQTSAEYWGRAASLLHTDLTGTKDLKPDANVRIYYIAGAQHTVSSSSKPGIFQYSVNTVDYRPILRALLVAMDAWGGRNVAPPESVYPTIKDKTLVDLGTYRSLFPRISGVRMPDRYYEPNHLDFGPREASEGILDIQPPKVGPCYHALVPVCDSEGNDLGGVRLPEVAVPMATYTGWNLREIEGVEGEMGRGAGSRFPLPATAEEQLQSADPRASIQDRYPNRDFYMAQVTELVLELHRQRFLLDEDVVHLLDRSTKQSVMLLLQPKVIEQ